MFDQIGWGELGVLLVLGLFVFGPERLPRVIGDVVRTFRQLRAQASSVTHDLKAELDPHLSELRGLDPRDELDLDADREPRAQRSSGARPTAAASAPRLAAGEVPPYDPDAT